MSEKNLQIKIQTAIDTANAAKSVAELKKGLKDLQNLSLQVGEGAPGFKKLVSAIGEGKDKIEDLNDSVKSLKGTGVEKLNQSFGLLKDSFSNFDPGKATTALKGVGTAMKAIPIFLVIEGIQLLIQNFDKVVAFFPSVNAVIKKVTDAFYSLTDALGFTTHADDVLTANTIKNSETRQKNATSEYDLQIRLAKAAHKETTDLELQKQDAIIQTSNVVISELERRAKAGHTLTEEEQKSLEESKKNLKDAEVSKVEIVAKAEDDKLAKQKEANEKAAKLRKDAKDKFDAEQKKLAEAAKAEQEKNDAEELSHTKTLLSTKEKLEKDSVAAKLAQQQSYLELKMQQDIQDVNDSKISEQAKSDAIVAIKTKELADIQALKLADIDSKKAQDLIDLEDEYNKSNRSTEAYTAYQDSIKLINEKASSDKLKLTEDSEKSIIQINKDAAKAKSDLEKKEKAERLANAQNSLAVAASVTTSLSNLSSLYFSAKSKGLKKGSSEELAAAKQQFKVNKALQLAQATVDGFKAVVSTFASTPGGPIIKGIAAGAAAAMAATNIAKIASSQFEAPAAIPTAADIKEPPITTPTLSAGPSTTIGSIGGTVGGGASPANVPVVPQGQVFNQGIINRQVSTDSSGNIIPIAQQQAQRVYVVESDITSTQNKVSVIESKATFGANS
jgi:hypothetical protein